MMRLVEALKSFRADGVCTSARFEKKVVCKKKVVAGIKEGGTLLIEAENIPVELTTASATLE
eukprot:5444564-Pyramimonas_sp.AAC.1